MLYPELQAQLTQLLTCKFGSVIGHQVSRDPKMAYNVFPHKILHLVSSYLCDWLGFNPLSEVFNGHYEILHLSYHQWPLKLISFYLPFLNLTSRPKSPLVGVFSLHNPLWLSCLNSDCLGSSPVFQATLVAFPGHLLLHPTCLGKVTPKASYRLKMH